VRRTKVRDRILIARSDHEKLSRLVANRLAVNSTDREYFGSLESELDRAEIVDPGDLPADVVAMNTEVTLRDLDTGDIKVYRLVYPTQTNTPNAISVLAPVGTAMLGYRVGDTIRWQVPRGIRRLEILQVLPQTELSLA
jgi:regulator of nucleoside diphosphate kinase